MILEDRVMAFQKLGDFFLNPHADSSFESIIQKACDNNPWFIKSNIEYAMFVFGELLCSNLKLFLKSYHLNNKVKKIGVVIPSNIPLVGFYDFLCVLLSGSIFIGKLSKTNNILLPFIANKLCYLNPEFEKMIFFEDSFSHLDLLIVTGNDNTAQYYHYLYSGVTKLIRNNRTSIAVLSGLESDDDYQKLSHDVYRYFGLGCRNVSKFFIPRGLSVSRFQHCFSNYDVYSHTDYMDNYNYHKSLCQMRDIDFIDFGNLLLIQSHNIGSPISVLYYDYYDDIQEVNNFVKTYDTKVQCVVSDILSVKNPVCFGNSQAPELCDFPDNIDVMNFIISN